ncbi:glycoside hydrolase family 76 protein [Paenibacillus roseipurpureus]|uniref:Glycoside hydrolase family 76 protein n=1 Tax=Paenibacillus roseopurpureus TaxID=2918901 RepID=A0AA96RNE7_9BACL|nr:glycoside hydrolase family 76 protein [Paenibacillus sp. MBLB1832]WNR45367.1 glycoside hydrolase family 76 protein [Paenibacillus sp. MBLB1832]
MNKRFWMRWGITMVGIIIILATWGVMNMGNEHNVTDAQVGNVSKADSWSQRADLAQAGLGSNYWNNKLNLFDNLSPCHDLCNEKFHYWWQAHGIDTLVDAYVRTGHVEVKNKLGNMYQGMLDRNGGVWPNDFYDDMEWLALAWLRAYEATSEERYKEAALLLWEDIKTGWNEEQGGGIAWRKPQLDYKNTPANAPAVILAARLYKQFGNAEDLVWAKKIYDWQRANLVDPESGFVWDGKNREGDGKIDKTWEFSYCQGVYIGAGVELFRATGDRGYLADAAQTAHASKLRLTSPITGMLPSESNGDGGLFKGIFVRYLTELVLADPSQKEALELLRTNAESLWSYGRDEQRQMFSKSWATTPEPAEDLSVNLSGVMLLECMAVLEKRGLLAVK